MILTFTWFFSLLHLQSKSPNMQQTTKPSSVGVNMTKHEVVINWWWGVYTKRWIMKKMTCSLKWLIDPSIFFHPSPGLGYRGSILRSDGQTFRSPHTSSSFFSGTLGVPRRAKRYSSIRVSWVFLKEMSMKRCHNHFNCSSQCEEAGVLLQAPPGWLNLI